MAEEERIPISKPEGHHCFACGTANPIGLNLQFFRIGDQVCSEITLGENHVGWENMIHGGIISTLLDEVMSWAILYFKRVLFVTRKMDLKYIRPVTSGTPLIVKGKLVDSSEPPKIRTQGEIRDKEGRLLVRSRAEFVEVPTQKLSAVPKGAMEEMLSLFETFP